jgi:hypothetical protein
MNSLSTISTSASGGSTIIGIQARCYYQNNYDTNSSNTIVPRFVPFYGGVDSGGIILVESAGNRDASSGYPKWSIWKNVSAGTSHPDPWEWQDVKDLDMRLQTYRPNSGTLYVYKTELRIDFRSVSSSSSSSSSSVSSSSLSSSSSSVSSSSLSSSSSSVSSSSSSVSSSSTSTLPIPQGLIVPLNDSPSNIPANWELWLASSASTMIMGAPSASSPSGSGGSNTVSSSAGTIFTTTAAGEHGSIGTQYYQTLYNGGTQFYSCVTGTQDEGDHSHDLEQFDYEPEYTGICFIKSTTELSVLPSNAVVLSESGITGLSNVLTNSGRLLKLHNSLSPFISGGGTPIADLTTGGSHFHGIESVETDGDPVNYQYKYGAFAGAHTPTDVSIYVDPNLKRRLMSAWTHSSQSFSPSSGMIGMWESWTPPVGWRICDGTNGTPDLRDHFVELVITGSEGSTGVGSHTLTISASDTHDFVDHDHSNPGGSLQNAELRVLVDHTDASFEHTHTGLVTDFSWKPLYQMVVFVKKI